MYKDRYNTSGASTRELHLRHLTVDEALPRLHQFLDDSFRAGLAQVRIVHGKGGAGIIKRLVRDVLKKHPLVRSFRYGGYGEGGDGVTIVEFSDK